MGDSVGPMPRRAGGHCACGGTCPRCSKVSEPGAEPPTGRAAGVGPARSEPQWLTAEPGSAPGVRGRGRASGETMISGLSGGGGEETEAAVESAEPGVTEAPVATPGVTADVSVPAQTAPGPAAGPSPVASITPNIGATGSTLAHVPACGNQPTVRFTAGPAGAAPVSWSLADGTAAVDPGTSVASPAPPPGATNPDAATLDADLTLGAAQTGGTIEVEAANASSTRTIQFPLASHPTGITSTRVVGDPTSSTRYGGVFDHEFTSNDGQASSLRNVAVGERFPGIPDPDAASHTLTTPFGDFTLSTGTLQDAANATHGNWFLTAAGELGGTHDNVTIARSMVDIGRHLVSDSNPTPAHPLPAGFTITQDWHWWCPHGAPGSRWTRFTAVTHRRELRLDASGSDAEFVAAVNGQENAIAYDGRTGVTHAVADPATVAPSPGGGAPANTVQISADAFPSGRQLHFSIQGNALGCSINARTGVLTIGSRTGTVRVRVANASRGPNWDEVDVTIANPPAPAPNPAPTPAPPSSPSSPTGGTLAPPAGDAS